MLYQYWFSRRWVTRAIISALIKRETRYLDVDKISSQEMDMIYKSVNAELENGLKTKTLTQLALEYSNLDYALFITMECIRKQDINLEAEDKGPFLM